MTEQRRSAAVLVVEDDRNTAERYAKWLGETYDMKRSTTELKLSNGWTRP